MGKKKRSPKPKPMTVLLMEAVEKAQAQEDESCFPGAFLAGLRAALDSGLSAEQLTALLVLFAGIYEVSGSMDGEELLEKAKTLVSVMDGDIVYVGDRRLLWRKGREHRTAKERERKRWRS